MPQQRQASATRASSSAATDRDSLNLSQQDVSDLRQIRGQRARAALEPIIMKHAKRLAVRMVRRLAKRSRQRRSSAATKA